MLQGWLLSYEALEQGWEPMNITIRLMVTTVPLPRICVTASLDCHKRICLYVARATFQTSQVSVHIVTSYMVHGASLAGSNISKYAYCSVRGSLTIAEVPRHNEYAFSCKCYIRFGFSDGSSDVVLALLLPSRCQSRRRKVYLTICISAATR
jgi:hypothetical protein